jgi:hypothetical protein
MRFLVGAALVALVACGDGGSTRQQGAIQRPVEGPGGSGVSSTSSGSGGLGGLPEGGSGGVGATGGEPAATGAGGQPVECPSIDGPHSDLCVVYPNGGVSYYDPECPRPHQYYCAGGAPPVAGCIAQGFSSGDYDAYICEELACVRHAREDYDAACVSKGYPPHSWSCGIGYQPLAPDCVPTIESSPDFGFYCCP